MRAKSYGFQTNTVLDVSQIIVPKSGVTSIPEVLEKSQKEGQLIVDVLKFCREYPEIKSSGSRMISGEFWIKLYLCIIQLQDKWHFKQGPSVQRVLQLGMRNVLVDLEKILHWNNNLGKLVNLAVYLP